MMKSNRDTSNAKSLFALTMFLSFALTFFGQDVTINEVLASNADYDYDDFFQYEDWIELYNSGGILNLAGFHLTDDADSLSKWTFPLDDPGLTTILPNGHIRIWCDKDEQQGSDHANFKLSGEGETVYFVDVDGITILDSVTFGVQQDDISYGASCDGCSDWQYFNTPTPEAANSETALAPSVLFINEVQPSNSSTISDEFDAFDSWVEIFNPNDFQVNMSGYSLELNGSIHTFQNIEPWLITIPANGFQIFWLDNQAEEGSNHLSILSNESGSLVIKGNDGVIIDSAEWDSNLELDHSWGRQLDGAPSWTLFEFPTARASNSIQIIQPGSVVINEVQSDNFITHADNAGEFDDWIEIYNFGSSPVDIANYYITDRDDQPQKYWIPTCFCDSTIIPPNGFLMLYADENGSQGWNHTNFKISSSGEPITLRSPDGFTIADAVDVPALGLGKSWGRIGDASLPWVEFNIPTPNASNGPTNDLFEWSDENEFKPFPNPIQTGMCLQVDLAGAMFNSSGTAVATWAGNGPVPVDLAPGLYIIQWKTGSGQVRAPSKIAVTQ